MFDLTTYPKQQEIPQLKTVFSTLDTLCLGIKSNANLSVTYDCGQTTTLDILRSVNTDISVNRALSTILVRGAVTLIPGQKTPLPNPILEDNTVQTNRNLSSVLHNTHCLRLCLSELYYFSSKAADQIARTKPIQHPAPRSRSSKRSIVMRGDR